MRPFYEQYIKLEHIGKGANAHVYKVRHAELGYIRAIKVLNEYIENKGESVYQSFLKECKTLLAIGNGCHPNIVRIYAPSLIDNHAIVEMDYIKGKTLDSYIKQKGFIDYEEVKTFINDIVGALAYTHYDIYAFLMDPEADNLALDSNDGSKYLITPQREAELVQKYAIVHNDLHSNNIMRRDYDGRFVLLDFGLAVQAGRCIKSSRMRDGSPEYQAPEKFDSDIIDPRSDVYSLGILMFEILAGRVPFVIQLDGNGNVSGRAIDVVLKQHQSATPPPILPFRKEAFERLHPGVAYERDYPEWLDNVIKKCLAKKPDARYKNAKELLADINAHLKNDAPDSSEIKKLKDTIAQLQAQLKQRDPVRKPIGAKPLDPEPERLARKLRVAPLPPPMAPKPPKPPMAKAVSKPVPPKPTTPEVKPEPKIIAESGEELLKNGRLDDAIDWYTKAGDTAKAKLLTEIARMQKIVETRKQSLESCRKTKSMWQIARIIRELSDYIGLCDKAGLPADEYKSLLREYTKIK